MNQVAQDTSSAPQAEAASAPSAEGMSTETKIAITAYALMLAGPLLWLTPLVAVVIAYVLRIPGHRDRPFRSIVTACSGPS